VDELHRQLAEMLRSVGVDVEAIARERGLTFEQAATLAYEEWQAGMLAATAAEQDERESALRPALRERLEAHRERAGAVAPRVESHTWSGASDTEVRAALFSLDRESLASYAVAAATARIDGELRAGPEHIALLPWADGLPVDEEDVEIVVTAAIEPGRVQYVLPWGHWSPLPSVVEVVDGYCRTRPAEPVREHIRRAVEEVERTLDLWGAPRTRLRSRLRRHLPADVTLVENRDAWGAEARRILADRPVPGELLGHLDVPAAKPAPTRAWLSRASDLLAAAGGADDVFRVLLEAAATAEIVLLPDHDREIPVLFTGTNAVFVRSLVWLAPTVGPEGWWPELVGRLAARCAAQPGGGPDPAFAVARGCFAVLTAHASDRAAALLSEARLALEDKRLRRDLDTALGSLPPEPPATARGLVVFKGEDYSEEVGEDIGPAFVVHDPDDPGSTESPDRWMPRSEAKQLAVELGYRFEVDGMTDEELAAWADELDG
jgi:hypothetical protein